MTPREMAAFDKLLGIADMNDLFKMSYALKVEIEKRTVK